MASKVQTLGIFTVVDATQIPRAPRNAREPKPLSEEVLKLAEDLHTLYVSGKHAKADIVGSKTVKDVIRDARKAADHAGLGLALGIETSEGVVRLSELPKEDNDVTYRLTLAPKEKTLRTRKNGTEVPAE